MDIECGIELGSLRGGSPCSPDRRVDGVEGRSAGCDTVVTGTSTLIKMLRARLRRRTVLGGIGGDERQRSRRLRGRSDGRHRWLTGLARQKRPAALTARRRQSTGARSTARSPTSVTSTSHPTPPTFGKSSSGRRWRLTLTRWGAVGKVRRLPVGDARRPASRPGVGARDGRSLSARPGRGTVAFGANIGAAMRINLMLDMSDAFYAERGEPSDMRKPLAARAAR